MQATHGIIEKGVYPPPEGLKRGYYPWFDEKTGVLLWRNFFTVAIEDFVLRMEGSLWLVLSMRV